LDQLEQLGGVINECSPGLARFEYRVGKESNEERDVGLDTSNSEFDQCSKHLSSGNLVSGTTDGTLDKQRVVMGSDLSSSVSRTSIKSNTISTSRSVNFDLTSIGLESLSGVFSRDSTLDGETSSVDMLLGKTELFEGDTSSNLDLGSNDIDTGNFLGNGVLDLDSGVDFDEIVSPLLVDQEFGSTGISVFDGSGELEGVVKDGLSDRLVKVGSGCDLDDLILA
jgi:hypothetical protein